MVERLLCAHLCAKPFIGIISLGCHSLTYTEGNSEAQRGSITCQWSQPGSELG